MNEAQRTRVWDDAFAAVQRARDPRRPRSSQVIAQLFTSFHELRGDRLYADDPSIIAGIGRCAGHWLVVVAQEKGVMTAEDRVRRNFGMAHPEGYRKAQRVMRLAERFGLPVLCLVDTPAAHAGAGAEERGQACAIAASLHTALELRTGIVSVLLSEGGSGGALALAVADRVLAMENAIYSVAPPETCAVILYRDVSQRHRAAALLRSDVFTARRLGLVDEIVAEPAGGAQQDPPGAVEALGRAVDLALRALSCCAIDDLVRQRRQRFRRAGDDVTGGMTTQVAPLR